MLPTDISGSASHQLGRVGEAPVGVEDHDDRAGEVELLVGPGEQHQLGLVQSLVDDLDQLLAQFLHVGVVRGVDDGQALGGRVVVQAVVAPGGEVVVVLAVGELRSQQGAPEVMVDAARVDVAQDVAQLAQSLGAATGRDDGERAVLDGEIDHRRTSCSRNRLE